MPTQMHTYQPTPISSEAQESNSLISHKVLAYFRARLSNRIHELVLTEFATQEREGQMSRAELARRIRRKPEQITRWLGSPGNWTLDTLSDLLLGMGLEPTLLLRSIPSLRGAHNSTIDVRYQAGTHYFKSMLDVQTAQEVARDIVTGNHKPLYISLRMPGTASVSSSTAATIEVLPKQLLPQQSLNVLFEIKDPIHANHK